MFGDGLFSFPETLTFVLAVVVVVVVVVVAGATPGPTTTESPAASEAAETPAPSTSYSKKMPEKSKRKGAPILNLFKRDTGPQRATTLEEALAAEVSTREERALVGSMFGKRGGVLVVVGGDRVELFWGGVLAFGAMEEGERRSEVDFLRHRALFLKSMCLLTLI